MSVTSPPRPPRRSVTVDPDELQALVEALIEEARQRARRRRRRRAAWILLAALVGVSAYIGFERGDGSTAAAPAASNGGVAVARTAERWGASHGPDGGPAYVVAVAPSDPRVAYLGTGRGIFRSRNGGRSWVSAAPPVHERYAGATSLLVDPHSATTVYAGLNGRWAGGALYGLAVYKTSDGGRTWLALPLRGQPLVITPTAIYAATGGLRKTSLLARSTDGGHRWQPADGGLPSTFVWGLAFAPSAPATMYAAMGRRGVYASNDAGTHWHPLDISPRWGEVTAITVDPSHPHTVYAATSSGVVVSHDAGRSWRMLNATIRSRGRERWYMQVTALLVDPRNSRTLYASTRCAGVFKSSDGGHRWSAADTGLDPQCPSAYSLAFDPRAPRIMYAADPTRGVVKSVDGAAHWRLSNRGLSLAYVWSLAVVPRQAQTVYAGAGALGLFKSDDGGSHWRSVATGLKGVYTVAVDPDRPATVLAAGSTSPGQTAPSPDSIARSTDAGRTWTRAAFATRWVSVVAVGGPNAYAGTADGFGVFGSTDGGRTWRSIGPRGVIYVQALAIDPRNPSVVYVGAPFGTTRGLYKSVDGGGSWQWLDALRVGVTAIALDPQSPSTVYAATGGGDGGVYRSTDGGTTWQPENTGLRVRFKTRAGRWTTTTRAVAALAVDPAVPATLYAATDGGVYRSSDGGESWRAFNAGLTDPDVTSLALDATGRTIYAGTMSTGVVGLRRNP